VYYTLTPDLPVSLWTVHEVVDSAQLTTLTNLLLNRTYALRLLAFTEVGDGPLSTVISVTTNTQHSKHRSTALLAVIQCQFRAGDTGPSKSWLGPQI